MFGVLLLHTEEYFNNSWGVRGAFNHRRRAAPSSTRQQLVSTSRRLLLLVCTSYRYYGAAAVSDCCCHHVPWFPVFAAVKLHRPARRPACFTYLREIAPLRPPMQSDNFGTAFPQHQTTSRVFVCIQLIYIPHCLYLHYVYTSFSSFYSVTHLAGVT